MEQLGRERKTVPVRSRNMGNLLEQRILAQRKKLKIRPSGGIISVDIWSEEPKEGEGKLGGSQGVTVKVND